MSEPTEPTPTMLYKPRDGAPNPEAWDRPFDTQIVGSDGVAAAQKDGWLTVADVAAADAKADAAKAPKAAS